MLITVMSLFFSKSSLACSESVEERSLIYALDLEFRSDFRRSSMLDIHDNINLLKPTGHVTHQQFNIQQLYALPTLYLYVLYLSENKECLVLLPS
jgi:hypothetical protein